MRIQPKPSVPNSQIQRPRQSSITLAGQNPFGKTSLIPQSGLDFSAASLLEDFESKFERVYQEIQKASIQKTLLVLFFLHSIYVALDLMLGELLAPTLFKFPILHLALLAISSLCALVFAVPGWFIQGELHWKRIFAPLVAGYLLYSLTIEVMAPGAQVPYFGSLAIFITFLLIFFNSTYFFWCTLRTLVPDRWSSRSLKLALIMGFFCAAAASTESFNREKYLESAFENSTYEISRKVAGKAIRPVEFARSLEDFEKD